MGENRISMTTTNEAVLAKIKKLRALAASTNEHEAAAAAAAAQTLMSRHQIDEATLAEARDDRPIDEPVRESDDPLDRSKVKVHWHGTLAGGVAKANGCRVFWRGGALKIIGAPTNVTTCRYLYGWLADEIDRVSKIRGAGQGRAWCHAFRLGAAQEVAKRLVEAAQEAAVAARAAAAPQGSGAIVLVDRALARINAEQARVDRWIAENMRLRRGTQSRVSDGSGYRAGQETGARMQIGGSAPSLGSGSARRRA